MAKKTQKGKPAKKAAKPVKKAVAKKPAKPARPAGGKAAPKKAAKPAKKVTPKKVVKKAAKPVKKAVAKKPVKKVVAKKAAKPTKKVVAKKPVKKVVKKVVAKKVVKKAAKPVKKAVAKKVAPKKAVKPAKKVVAKKVVAKKIAKPVKKVVAKVVKPAKPVKVAKPVVKAAPAKPDVVAKPLPVAKKKERSLDLDDDGKRRNYDDAPMVVEYKTPSIRRPMGPTPKPHVNTDTRTRYSDAELKEFKELILKKLGEAQKDYELLKSTLSHRDDHGTDDTSPTFKLLEDGSDVLSKEETAHLAARQEKFIQSLQNALIRIENKTYGICRATGKLISKERLRSVPHATLAIEAKLEQSN
jgi:RNA polymerase-binding transcription factor DksA